MLKDATAKYSMTSSHMRLLRAGLLALVLLACRDKREGAGDSARGLLPPVFPSGPASSTNWDVDAGPVMLVSMGNSMDSAAVILPEVSDSTIASVQGTSAPVDGLVFDLYGRTGKFESSMAVAALRSDSTQECYSWPLVGLRAPSSGWRIGFASGHVQAIKLDSIDAMASTDSATLAASLAQTAATLAIASDPTFRGLPFRVRSAYTFRLNSVDAVTGRGEVKVSPDRATIQISVQTRASTAAAAAAENANKQQAVLAALRALGLGNDQLSTINYNVYPEQRYEQGKEPVVVAYNVTNTILAEVRKLSQVGPVIDAALSHGANMIASLQFYASNTEAARRTAIATAIEKARADAEAAARAARGTLGTLLECLEHVALMAPLLFLKEPIS